MKHLVFIALSCLLLSSCKEKEEIIGVNTDPELNILEYTFSNEGGSIEVYSQIDCELQFYYNPYDYVVEDPKIETPTDLNNNGLDGGWYKVTYMIGEDSGWLNKKILIEVQPNETGKERVIPIQISNLEFFCKNLYKQAE